jgi:hypothetical protein
VFLDISIETGQHPLLEPNRTRSRHDYIVVTCSCVAQIEVDDRTFRDLSLIARTGGLTVTSAPLSGTWFRSPSGAAKAVVAALKPGVTPNPSGYDFWFVAGTGKTLASIRTAVRR